MVSSVALLVRVDTEERWHPPSEAVVGRSESCTLRLPDSDVSKEHASVRWVGDGWEVRDLNSRNGTFVAGERLGPRESGWLVPGTTLCFGASSVWRVEDDGPPAPAPAAVRVGDGRRVTASDRLLAIPSEDDPQATVHCDKQGRWVLEQDDRVSEACDGMQVTVGDETWALQLPSASETTAEPVEPARVMGAATLSFLVSPDEEHVSIAVETPHRRVDLGARSFHYLTLTLARTRLEDERAGVPPEECGWLHHKDLLRMLSIKRNHFDVSVYRIRKQFEAAGFIDAAHCIERRLSTGQLRLGIGRIRIRSTADASG